MSLLVFGNEYSNLVDLYILNLKLTSTRQGAITMGQEFFKQTRMTTSIGLPVVDLVCGSILEP